MRDIQLCMTLYNERIYTYERMALLNNDIDEHPELAGQMVAEDISNHLAFVELQSYNDRGEFVYKHPILIAYKKENELEALRKSNPERFINEMVNADKAITRYKSQINTGKYKNDEERQQFEAHIASYQEKLEIMKRLISSH